MNEFAYINGEVFSDFFRPIGVYYAGGAVVERDSAVQSHIGFHRTRSDGDFSDADLRLLRGLLPHIRQSVRLSLQLIDARSDCGAREEALDLVPLGFVLAATDGKVLHANRAARAVLDARDGLRVVDGRLAAARAEQSAALMALISAAGRTAEGKGTSAGGALRVDRGWGKPSLTVRVLPLDVGVPATGRRPRATAAVVFKNPECPARVPETMLRQLYGLTPAEARIASGLVEGDAPRTIAERAGISYETVRRHIKEVFQKTETHRQSELMRLILSDPGVIDNRSR